MMNRRHISLLGVFLAAAILLICFAPGEVSAASSSEIKNQILDLQSQKQQLQEQIDALKAKTEENAESLQERLL